MIPYQGLRKSKILICYHIKNNLRKNMFFEKLKNNESGILLYGQTPPKQNHQNLENLLELRKKKT